MRIDSDESLRVAKEYLTADRWLMMPLKHDKKYNEYDGGSLGLNSKWVKGAGKGITLAHMKAARDDRVTEEDVRYMEESLALFDDPEVGPAGTEHEPWQCVDVAEVYYEVNDMVNFWVWARRAIRTGSRNMGCIYDIVGEMILAGDPDPIANSLR